MIKLDRGPEPGSLRTIRIAELQRVGKIAAIREPNSAEVGDRYRDIREDLWLRQNYKCCFCECKEQLEYKDVEHYRPKAEVKHSRHGPIRPGYWWLAWTWENLMFSCPACNRSFKRIWFPLDEASIPLGPMESPPGCENPLLIDPYVENPIDHIQFKRFLVGDRDRWCPFPRDQSLKGEWTIEIAGLGRDKLLKLYDDHFIDVEPRLQDIREALARKEPGLIAQIWKRATVPLLQRRMPFSGLSYDILDDAFPVSIRAEFDLDLNRNF